MDVFVDRKGKIPNQGEELGIFSLASRLPAQNVPNLPCRLLQFGVAQKFQSTMPVRNLLAASAPHASSARAGSEGEMVSTMTDTKATGRSEHHGVVYYRSGEYIDRSWMVMGFQQLTMESIG